MLTLSTQAKIAIGMLSPQDRSDVQRCLNVLALGPDRFSMPSHVQKLKPVPEEEQLFMMRVRGPANLRIIFRETTEGYEVLDLTSRSQLMSMNAALNQP